MHAGSGFQIQLDTVQIISYRDSNPSKPQPFPEIGGLLLPTVNSSGLQNVTVDLFRIENDPAETAAADFGESFGITPLPLFNPIFNLTAAPGVSQ